MAHGSRSEARSFRGDFEIYDFGTKRCGRFQIGKITRLFQIMSNTEQSPQLRPRRLVLRSTIGEGLCGTRSFVPPMVQHPWLHYLFFGGYLHG
jgi:hypothetical protein